MILLVAFTWRLYFCFSFLIVDWPFVSRITQKFREDFLIFEMVRSFTSMAGLRVQGRWATGLPPTEGLPPSLFLSNDRCLRDYDLVVVHC